MPTECAAKSYGRRNIGRVNCSAAFKATAALDVDCADDSNFSRRLREKKSALNQADLAELIHAGQRTIYLCGENFSVPIRVADMNYVGVLSTPKIKIRAQSQADLDAQNIIFANVRLPWQNSAPIDELKALAEKIFQTGGKFPIVKGGKQVSTFDALTAAQRAAKSAQASCRTKTFCKRRFTPSCILTIPTLAKNFWTPITTRYEIFWRSRKLFEAVIHVAKKIFLIIALIIFTAHVEAADDLPFVPLATTVQGNSLESLTLIRNKTDSALYFVVSDSSAKSMAFVPYSRKIYDFYRTADEYGLYSPLIFEMSLPNQPRGQLDDNLGEWRQNIHVVPVYALFDVRGGQIICDKPFFSASYLNPSHYHDRIQNPVHVRLIEILLTHMPRLHEQVAARGVVLP